MYPTNHMESNPFHRYDWKEKGEFLILTTPGTRQEEFPIKNKTEPCKSLIRLDLAATADDNYGWNYSKHEMFEVPFPHLLLAINETYKQPLMFMSHDGKEWQKAEFPHVERGNLDGCMQGGTYVIDEDNILMNIVGYAQRYVTDMIASYWRPEERSQYSPWYTRQESKKGIWSQSIHAQEFFEWWSENTEESLMAIIQKRFEDRATGVMTRIM